MKNKELEAKANEEINTLKSLMEEIASKEAENDSLTLEVNNLKTRNLTLTQEVEALRREHIEDQATIEKYQALKPKQNQHLQTSHYHVTCISGLLILHVLQLMLFVRHTACKR